MCSGSTTFKDLPILCLERVVAQLDFISAFLLACTSRFHRSEVLPLWIRRHGEPVALSDVGGGHAHSERFLASIKTKLDRWPIFTSSPCFEQTSVIPTQLQVRHAVAALDIAFLLPYVAPVPKCSVRSAVRSSARSEAQTPLAILGQTSGGRSPLPKVTPFQIAIACRSARVVQAMLHEPLDRLDETLINNAEGRMPSLDLNIARLPNAHLGVYSHSTPQGSVGVATRSRQVTVRRVDRPPRRRIYAQMDTAACVNTGFLLEFAVLVHEPKICELLCESSPMQIPARCVAELFVPRATSCAESYTRIGSECRVPRVLPVDKAGTCTTTRVQVESTRAAAAGTDSSLSEESGYGDCITVCENLAACPYVLGLRRILKALVQTRRALGLLPHVANMAADLGDLKLLDLVARSCHLSSQEAADIKNRLIWRLTYDSIKVRRISEKRKRFAASKLPVFYHPCIQQRALSSHSYGLRKVEPEAITTRIVQYASMIREHRTNAIAWLESHENA